MSGTYATTALLVLEILSPGDATWRKLAFYASHGVGEILVADPPARTIRCLRLTAGDYVEHEHCALLDLPIADLTAAVVWPA